MHVCVCACSQIGWIAIVVVIIVYLRIYINYSRGTYIIYTKRIGRNGFFDNDDWPNARIEISSRFDSRSFGGVFSTVSEICRPLGDGVPRP